MLDTKSARMWSRGSFVRAAAVAMAGALASPRRAAAQETGIFSPAALQTDLDFLWNAMLAVGPVPFRTADRTQVESLYHTVRSGLRKPLGAAAFVLRVAPVFAALNDGHVQILAPMSAVPVVSFPLLLEVVDEDLIVTADGSHTIPFGSRLISLEQLSASRLRDLALAHLGAQTPALHRWRAASAMYFLIAELLGGPDRRPYDVAWVAPDGTAHRAVVSEPVLARTKAAPEPPYSYRTLAEGTVAHIDYRSCEDLPRFERFLETTFASIRGSGVRALVIDIRKNGGGDSKLNDLLWQYVTNKPFKQYGGTLVRSSSLLKQHYGREQYDSLYGGDAWDAPEGALIGHSSGDGDLVRPTRNPLRFAGPVYLLIGPQTFSSAMSCASAAKDYGLATLVGEETGEPVNATGEAFYVTAPSTGTAGLFTTKYFLAPKPHPDRQGVIPDIVVPTTLADRIAGRDPVLERTLALIAAQTPRGSTCAGSAAQAF